MFSYTPSVMIENLLWFAGIAISFW